MVDSHSSAVFSIILAIALLAVVHEPTLTGQAVGVAALDCRQTTNLYIAIFTSESPQAIANDMGLSDLEMDNIREQYYKCQQNEEDELQVVGVEGCDVDTDKDNVVDCEDNCPFAFNPLQEDDNQNGIGNECDGKVVYVEDFEQKTPGDIDQQVPTTDLTWSNYQAKGQVHDTSYTKELTASREKFMNTFTRTQQEFADFSMSFDIRKDWSSDVGLVFYVQDEENYYYITLSDDGKELLNCARCVENSLVKVINGQRYVIATATQSFVLNDEVTRRHSFTVDVTPTNRGLEVSISSDTLRRPVTFVDVNPSFGSGGVGFYELYQKYRHTYIDNIEITDENAIATGS